MSIFALLKPNGYPIDQTVSPTVTQTEALAVTWHRKQRGDEDARWLEYNDTRCLDNLRDNGFKFAVLLSGEWHTGDQK